MLSDAPEDRSLLSPLDLYCICQTILFHDVGNLFGRKKHNQTIYKVISDKFSNVFTNKREKNAIIQAGRAHTGKSSEGSDDTLKELSNTTYHISGEIVRLRDIATIVRFADELAEGPQRTCQYMLEEGLFPEANEIFHRYASCTHLLIDPNNERISLHYEIELETDTEDQLSSEQKDKLVKLLNFAYERIDKLDQERKYASYYCDLLKPIKKTVANFEFSLDGCCIGEKPTIILDDLVVPGTQSSIASGTYKELNADSLVERIEQALISEREDNL